MRDNDWKEWRYQYNSFNSLKVLAWREQLEEMAKGKFPVPISVTVDPTNICNVNCIWCIWSDMRKMNPMSLPDEVLLEMPKFLADWGVKSVCVAGGGEPFCHPKIGQFLQESKSNGLSVGIITNGLGLEDKKLREIVVETARWVGFSVDAATNETYMNIKTPKSVNTFNRVLENISWVCENRSEGKRPQVGMKFLIHHFNYREMYQFADMAKKLGADEVHFRPVYLPGYKFTKEVREDAAYQLKKSRELEDENFRIFGILHKFEEKWTRAIRFKKCLATPIAGFFLADGTYSICCDRRDDPEMNLGKFYPFVNFLKQWGGENHKKMVEKIQPMGCPRCTQAITNEVIEKVIIKDEMTIEFV